MVGFFDLCYLCIYEYEVDDFGLIYLCKVGYDFYVVL